MANSCRPKQSSNFFYCSSDSSTGSETDEDEVDLNSCQLLPTKADMIKLLKESKRTFVNEFILDDYALEGLDSPRTSRSNKLDIVSTSFCKPRSSRLRPFPYITSTNFDQPVGDHEIVLQQDEIDKKVNKGQLVCLEEYSYAEFRPTKWTFDRRSDFEHEPTVLGDLGPLFSMKAKENIKKKYYQKIKKGTSNPLCEEMDEKEKEIALLCDSMPNVVPPIRCYSCKDWIKSSSFARHIFDHIVQDKQAFPSDDKHNWCAHCNRSFESDFELRDHYMMVSRNFVQLISFNNLYFAD